MATNNPFSKIVSTKQAEAAKIQAAPDHRDDDGRDRPVTHQGTGAGAAAPVPTPVSAAASALHEAADARAARQAADQLGRHQPASSAPPPEADTAVPAATAVSQAKAGTEASQPRLGVNPLGRTAQRDDESSTTGKELPDALRHNPDAGANAGAAQGLPDIAFHDPKDDVANRDVVSSAEDAASVPSSPADGAAERSGQGGAFNGLTTQEALSAAGGHQADVGSTLTRGAVADLLNRPAPGSDVLTGALTGLLNEAANGRATSPSAADGSDPLTDAIKSVTQADRDAAAKDAGVSPSSGDPLAIGAGEAESDGGEAEEKGVLDTISDFLSGDRPFFGEIDIKTASPSRDFSEVDGFGTVGTTTQAEAAKEVGVSNFETAMQKSLGSGKGAGVKDPGSDPDVIGGPPTAAEIAFVQALRAQAGIVRIPGDVDPVEGDGTQGAPVDAGTAAGIVASRSEESLVGNPGTSDARGPSAGPTGGTPGTLGPHQGGDVDPEEGSAFTGGTRGGNPEDVNVGGSAPLAPPASSDSDDGSDDDNKQSSIIDPTFGLLNLEIELPISLHLPGTD